VAHADGQLAPLFRGADARLYMAKQKGRNRAELD
jgi:PleD family two-component response regulator